MERRLGLKVTGIYSSSAVFRVQPDDTIASLKLAVQEHEQESGREYLLEDIQLVIPAPQSTNGSLQEDTFLKDHKTLGSYKIQVEYLL